MHRIQGSGVVRHSVTRYLSAGDLSHATSQASSAVPTATAIRFSSPSYPVFLGAVGCCGEHSKTQKNTCMRCGSELILVSLTVTPTHSHGLVLVFRCSIKEFQGNSQIRNNLICTSSSDACFPVLAFALGLDKYQVIRTPASPRGGFLRSAPAPAANRTLPVCPSPFLSCIASGRYCLYPYPSPANLLICDNGRSGHGKALISSTDKVLHCGDSYNCRSPACLASGSFACASAGFSSGYSFGLGPSAATISGHVAILAYRFL